MLFLDSKKYSNIIECVVDTQEGVDGAFDTLYSMSYPYAYSAASHLLKSHEDIEDALQNSFYYVSKNISRLREPAAYLKWLNTIVINECKKVLLEHNKHSKIFFAEKNRLMLAENSQIIDNNLIEKSDLIETISKMIDEMNPKKSEVLKLYYFENLSYSEISEKLGIPVGTVMSRLHHAKRELEKKVKDLQKGGTVLWSLPILPLVAALLSYNVKADISSAVIGKSIGTIGTATAASAATSSSIGAAGTTATVASVGASGTATAAATVGTSIAVKAAAVAVAATVAVGGGAAAKKFIEKQTVSAETVFTETVENTKQILSTANDEDLSELISPAETQSTRITEESEETAELIRPETTTKVVSATSALESTTSSDTKALAKKTASQSKSETRTRRSENKSQTESSAPSSTEKPTESTTAPTTASTTKKPAETTAKPSTTANPEAGLTVSGGVLSGYSGSGGNVNIPSTVNGQAVTAIGAGAFEGSNITSVSIPSGVTKIGQTSFSDCKKLTSVSLPSTLTGIGDCAFDGCSSLNSITIPDSVTSIGDDAFDGCDNLTIRCSEGSAAYEYAVENSVDYELI